MKRTLLLLGFIVLPALAQEAEPQTPQDWNKLRTQAAEMRNRSRDMRAAAEATFITDDKACWQKFLVSSCQEAARKARRDVEREAKRIEVEAGTFERRIATHDREERKARHAAEAPQRAAEAVRRDEEIRRHEAEALRRQVEKQADIERRQASGH